MFEPTAVHIRCLEDAYGLARALERVGADVPDMPIPEGTTWLDRYRVDLDWNAALSLMVIQTDLFRAFPAAGDPESSWEGPQRLRDENDHLKDELANCQRSREQLTLVIQGMERTEAVLREELAELRAQVAALA